MRRTAEQRAEQENDKWENMTLSDVRDIVRALQSKVNTLQDEVKCLQDEVDWLKVDVRDSYRRY